MDMNTISQNTILGLLLAGTVVAFCMAAREDYNMDVLDTIPDEVYEEIVSNLGEDVATAISLMSTWRTRNIMTACTYGDHDEVGDHAIGEDPVMPGYDIEGNEGL